MSIYNKKGFVHLHVVVPIIAVLLVGMIGAWVWNNSKALTAWTMSSARTQLVKCRDSETRSPGSAYLRADNKYPAGTLKYYCTIAVQSVLQAYGYRKDIVLVDGWYGWNTAKYVGYYQAARGLYKDGQTGVKTYNNMIAWIDNPSSTSYSVYNGWTHPNPSRKSVGYTYWTKNGTDGYVNSVPVPAGPNGYHRGIDFRAGGVSTNVLSACNGVVSRIRQGGINAKNSFDSTQYTSSNYIYVRCSGTKYETGYHHTYVNTGLKLGSGVLKGQKLGITDKSGLASGPHLHFVLRDVNLGIDINKGFVDPKTVIGIGW